MTIANIAPILMIIVLTGCASGYKITYDTEPSAASIICNGIDHGYSPVTLNYNSDESNKRTGTMRTAPCTAIWSSGVRKDFSTTWDLKKFPDGVTQTLQRPSGKGYSQDANFALKSQQLKLQAKTNATLFHGNYITSQIDGDFNGFEGETIIKLMNGQIWQQTEYWYQYHYSFMPKVIIFKSGGGYIIKVDGVDKAVGVTLLN